MRHSKFKKLIDKYLAYELPEELQASFEEHMLDCESCKEKLMLSQAVVDGLADIKVPEKDTAVSFIQRLKILITTALHPLYYPVPAGVTIILLIAVGLSVFFIMPNPPLDQPMLSFISGSFDPKHSELELEDKTTISYWLKQYRELDTSDPRSRMVHDIFNRLVQVADPPGRGIPKLVILKDASENLIFSLSDSHIILSEGVIEKCNSLLKDPEYVKVAIAFILGHELAHQLNGDYWGHRLKAALGFREDLPKHLRSRLKDLAKAQEAAYYIRTQELKADTKGIITASLAGYDVSLLLKEDGFINQWARSTLVSSDKTHPDPKQRQEAIKTLLLKVQKEAHSFYLGVRLAQIGRYSEAIQALEHFSIYYPSREVFTNLGVTYHLWALSISNPHADPNKPIYKRSLTMEPILKAFLASREYAAKDSYQEKLNKALIYYRKALNAAPQNPVMWHNLACCLADKEENLDLALGHVTQAILLDPDYYQAYNTRGTIYMSKGMINEAYNNFNKAKSYENYSDPFYNLAILTEQKVQYLENVESYLNLDSTSAWADRLIRRAEDLDLGEVELIKRAKKDFGARKVSAFSLPEKIEGKGVSDTQQSFSDPNDLNFWGEPDKTYEIALTEGKAEVWIYKRDTKSLKVCFIDKQVVFIDAGFSYKGKSSKGIGIGDDNIIYEQYGSPQKVFWCVGRQILVYPALGIGFDLEKNKVRGWFLFDKKYF